MLRLKAMTLRGGEGVEFFAWAATGKGRRDSASDDGAIRATPIRIRHFHRENKPPQECAPSARWSAIRQVPDHKKLRPVALFSPPLPVAAKAKNSTTQPPRSVITIDTPPKVLSLRKNAAERHLWSEKSRAQSPEDRYLSGDSWQNFWDANN
jgi:hypothetical protein